MKNGAVQGIEERSPAELGVFEIGSEHVVDNVDRLSKAFLLFATRRKVLVEFLVDRIERSLLVAHASHLGSEQLANKLCVRHAGDRLLRKDLVRAPEFDVF